MHLEIFKFVECAGSENINILVYYGMPTLKRLCSYVGCSAFVCSFSQNPESMDSIFVIDSFAFS